MSLSRSTRGLALLAVVVVGTAASPAVAQRFGGGSAAPPMAAPRLFVTPVNPNFPRNAPQTAQQFLFNSAVVGRAIRNVPRDVRALSFGVNPYQAPIVAPGPFFPNPIVPFPPLNPIAPISPYGLSTIAPPASYPAGATLSTSPYGGYSLSTAGGVGGGGFADPGLGGFGWGFPGITGDITAGQTLQGLASFTNAYGQYLMSTQQASRMREDVRQAKLDTYRKRVQYEAWYESMRLTSNQMRDREIATELDRARRNAPASEIYSGKSLNDLYRSVQKLAGRNNLNRGPQVDLTDIKLESIQVSGREGGNVGLLKGERDGALTMNWPAALEGKAFEEWQPELNRTLREAVAALKKGDAPSKAKLQDIDNLLNKMNDRLNDRETADEMSPSQYIEASRYLKQVKQAVTALRSPNATNYFNDTWKAQGRTVAELLDNMQKHGLEFAAAAPGDEAAYVALYHAMRAFEGGLQNALSTNSGEK